MKTAIASNLNKIKSKLGIAKLVVVSKTRSIEELEAVYEAGYRTFAENRVQNLLERKEKLPTDIEWHLIGHLQTNKVKYIAPFIAMIQSVDSESLLIEINRQAAKNQRTLDVLLQVFIATEETKFGFSETEVLDILNRDFSNLYPNVKIRGLMGMASNTDNKEQVRQEFSTLHNFYLHCKTLIEQKNINGFDTLSMGMSSDYLLAIEQGSNLVRIGSAIFETH